MEKLIYLFLTVLIVACNNSKSKQQSDCNVIYLGSNGVTIKACEDANIDDTGVINGVTYTVVNRTRLRKMIANKEDVTKVVTTRVTDMSKLFNNDINFNLEEIPGNLQQILYKFLGIHLSKIREEKAISNQTPVKRM